MAQINFENWVGEISLRANGAPQPVVLSAIRRSAQQFCADTRIWDQSLGSAQIDPPAADSDLEVDVPSADYSLPDMARLLAIADALIDGTSSPAKAFAIALEIVSWPATGSSNTSPSTRF